MEIMKGRISAMFNVDGESYLPPDLSFKIATVKLTKPKGQKEGNAGQAIKKRSAWRK